MPKYYKCTINLNFNVKKSNRPHRLGKKQHGQQSTAAKRDAFQTPTNPFEIKHQPSHKARQLTLSLNIIKTINTNSINAKLANGAP